MKERPQMPTSRDTNSTAQTEEAVDPGRNLAVAGFIFAFVFAIVGLTLSIVARNKSEKAGYNNTLAMIGIVVSIVNMILGVIINYSGLLRT